MSRGRRIALWIAGSLGGLLMILLITGIVIVQTQWFRDKVRTKIVSAVETATGGKAEIRSFSFDWRHLQAEIRDFTLHGLEEPGSAPLFHANFLQVNLKIVSPFRSFVDIAYLLVDTPHANVIVYGDGHTNMPAPNVPAKSSDKTGLETVVDLAVGRFDLKNGSFSFGDRQSALDASGGNLRAQLSYRMLRPAYIGEIDISPLHVRSAGHAPVDVQVKLPITLEKDRIAVADAQLTTPESHIVLSAAMDHLVAPHTTVQGNFDVSLDELRRAAGLDLALDLSHGPRMVSAQVNASMDGQTVRIQQAHLTLGQSNIEASGDLQTPGGGRNANFTATVDLTELGRLLRVDARPEGVVKLAGSAGMDAQNRYSVDGNIDARQVALHSGNTRITGVSLDSKVVADSSQITLSGLRLGALGGTFTGEASLAGMSEFKVGGRLQGLNIEQITRSFMAKPLGYDGVISGPLQANGSVKNPKALVAHASLTVSPSAVRAARGVPVSGKLNIEYNGQADTMTLAPSYIALPQTRADLSGQLGRQIQVKVISKSMADLQPLGDIPVTFGRSGVVNLQANVSGSLSAPKISGNIVASDFSVSGRPFSSFSADLSASPSGATVTNALVSRGPLAASVSASIALRDWKALPTSALRADASVRNADVSDVLALTGETSVAVTGAITADAHIGGTLGSPTGTVDASAGNGTIEGEKFDSFTLQARMSESAITIPALSLVAGAARLDGNATFQHPPNDLEHGTITGKVSGNQVQLAQFQSLVKDRPGLQGVISMNADGTANMQTGNVELTALTANVSAKGLAMEGKALGDLTATANTAGSAVRYTVTSDFAGSTIHVTGQSELKGDHRTSADAAISNLPIDRALAIAGRRDLPIAGVFTGTAQVSGTLADPHATANFTVANGSAYQEPFTSLQADVTYSNREIQLPKLHLTDGASVVDANASLLRPVSGTGNSDLRFHVSTNQVHLAGLRAVKQAQPGLDGIVQLNADGAAQLRPSGAPLFSSLNANVHATGVKINQQDLGDLAATASTRGSTLDFNLTSNLAHADVKGSGTMELKGNYPVNAHLTFAKVTYRGLSPLISAEKPLPVDGDAEGEMTISGPVSDTDQLKGSVQITKLEAHSAQLTGVGAKPRVNLDLKNEGNIAATLDHGVVTLTNFRLSGSNMALNAGGTVGLQGTQAMRLRVDGNVNLAMLEAFSNNIYSSGTIALHADATGTLASPRINGTLQLQKASFNLLDLPNGISNATGTVSFNGTSATIANLTGETGGGKVTVAGTVLYGGPQMRFNIQANANRVHIRYPDTITTEATANLSLSGTSSRSMVTGTVRILDVSMHQGADVGNVLTAAATPPAVPSSSSGALAGMHFDVRISTSPSAQFRTTLTQNLQASADLTLLGTPDNPGMVGRVTVTGGEVVFFGNQYTIDQGAMSFFNATKIDPMLNVSLKTTAQGVDVSLSVTGPVDKMKLAYSSDPPMPFQQLVSLLASGKTPTTDPVLAAHQPPPADQNLQQTGASAVLGQAVANPISGRLQRLFGVSKLSIDPQIIGTTNTAQATLTLQQQITKDITFTYIQDVTDSNPEVVRVEWNINPRYSAVAQKDVNGEVTVNLFYKKKFH